MHKYFSFQFLERIMSLGLTLNKIPLAMRLFVLILICSITLVHASNSYAQNTVIKIEVQNKTVSEVLSEIEKQSDFTFFFNNKHVDQNRKVSVAANNSNIFKILDEIFKGTQVKYSVLGKKIILSTEIQTSQQERKKRVTGKICDANGEPLIGASIQVKGTTIGSITDIDGNYSLEVPDDAVLVISYIGYIAQEVSVGIKNVVNIALKEDAEVLDEVVVVGYGVQKKSDVTGAMIRVNSEDLTSRPVANAFEAMQGKAAGVDITSNERPGEIGTINIRGVRSLSASNTPLYVVDGIPLMSNSGIETLNPQDIESIDVLKDASATAIYGSRGANGVVLVTTKQGKEGKMSLNYSGTMTIETLQDYSEMMNSAEYIEWRRWAYY